MGRSTFELTSKSQVQQSHPSQDQLEQLMMSQQPDNSRIVVIHGDVNEGMIAGVIAQLLHLANLNTNPISLVVSTYGGSVDEMFGLYDTIKFLPCPVHTIALGKVMSAGVLLLASGEKGKRLIGKSARIMIHPVSSGVHGNVFDLMHETNEIRRVHDMMVSALVSETKMTPSEIEAIMKSGNDYYINAEDAVEKGIVDRIVGNSKSKK